MNQADPNRPPAEICLTLRYVGNSPPQLLARPDSLFARWCRWLGRGHRSADTAWLATYVSGSRKPSLVIEPHAPMLCAFRCFGRNGKRPCVYCWLTKWPLNCGTDCEHFFSLRSDLSHTSLSREMLNVPESPTVGFILLSVCSAMQEASFFGLGAQVCPLGLTTSLELKLCPGARFKSPGGH